VPAGKKMEFSGTATDLHALVQKTDDTSEAECAALKAAGKKLCCSADLDLILKKR